MSSVCSSQLPTRRRGSKASGYGILIRVYNHQISVRPAQPGTGQGAAGQAKSKLQALPFESSQTQKGRRSEHRSGETGKGSQKQPHGGARSPPNQQAPTAHWSGLSWEREQIHPLPSGSQSSGGSKGRNADRRCQASAVCTAIVCI